MDCAIGLDALPAKRPNNRSNASFELISNLMRMVGKNNANNIIGDFIFAEIN